MLKFQVSDQGIGIKPEDKAKLFKLFGKLEATASINTSGIGIGLNICKQIVESFGGTIYIEDNRETTGTTFTFTIRCKIENPDPVFVSLASSVQSARSKHEGLQLLNNNNDDDDDEQEEEPIDLDINLDISNDESLEGRLNFKSITPILSTVPKGRQVSVV